jgi:hypothetical protein
VSARAYGLMAELATADALLEAAKRSRAAGYGRIEAYSPFPVEGLSEAIGFEKNRVPLLVLLGGIAGGAGGYFMQWYSAVVSYPINVGGRPLHSWPSFIPATFELTVLGAALAAVLGMLFLNGLPRLVHPVFNAPDFDLATRNRFFLCLCAEGAGFDAQAARRFLEGLQPLRVVEVPL